MEVAQQNEATREAVPPPLGTDQMPVMLLPYRAKKTRVELRARMPAFVPSDGASVITAGGGGGPWNFAVTRVVPFRVSAQPPDPLQLSLQPAKDQPLSGVAASATEVPMSNAAVQVPPQSMPAGDERTLPCPS